MYYHAQFPIDTVYVVSEVYLRTGKIVGGVSHRETFGFVNPVLRVSPFLKFNDLRVAHGFSVCDSISWNSSSADSAVTEKSLLGISKTDT